MLQELLHYQLILDMCISDWLNKKIVKYPLSDALDSKELGKEVTYVGEAH